MTDWKAVGIGALVNAVLTMVFTLVLFPLFFLGPVIGGFMATYLVTRKYRVLLVIPLKELQMVQ